MYRCEAPVQTSRCFRHGRTLTAFHSLGCLLHRRVRHDVGGLLGGDLGSARAHSHHQCEDQKEFHCKALRSKVSQTDAQFYIQKCRYFYISMMESDTDQLSRLSRFPNILVAKGRSTRAAKGDNNIKFYPPIGSCHGVPSQLRFRTRHTYHCPSLIMPAIPTHVYYGRNGRDCKPRPQAG